MAELKATPVQNNRALALTKLLRSGRDLGNKLQIPESIPLLGGQGVGDMFLGKAPEEVENWAYGNYPFQIPEMSNIPTMKTGRAEGVFDALSMIPTGAGGAGQAGTLPFKRKHLISPKGGVNRIADWVENGIAPYDNLSSNTKKIMERLVTKADKLRKPETLQRVVHDPDEIRQLMSLRQGDIYEVPRMLSTSRGLDDGVLEEISDMFGETFPIQINAPTGAKIGGDLGTGNDNYYNEFLLSPGTILQRTDDIEPRTFDLASYSGADPEYVRPQFRALTESEANLAKRKAMLKKLREQPPSIKE